MKKDFKLKNLICLVLQFLCAYSVAFSTWIHVDYYIGDHNFTIPGLYRLAQIIDGYSYLIPSSAETAIWITVIVLYGFLAVGIWVAWGAFSDSFSGYVVDALFTYCIAMSVTAIVLIWIMNLTVQNATDSSIDSVFQVGGGIIFTLVVSILGKILANRMPDIMLSDVRNSAAKTLENAVTAPAAGNTSTQTQTAQQPVQQPQPQPQPAPQPQTARRFCPHCGKAVASGMIFCPYCGGKLAPEENR